jgi:hypothetical protein
MSICIRTTPPGRSPAAARMDDIVECTAPHRVAEDFDKVESPGQSPGGVPAGDRVECSKALWRSG